VKILNKMTIEISKGKLLVCRGAFAGDELEDVIIKTANGRDVSLKQILKNLGEL
jgi:hypothetical protein